MSYETTMARAESVAAEANWRNHKRDCPVCMTAARSRAWRDLCSRGKDLESRKRATAEVLRRERELDKAPPPGAATLF